MQYSSREQLKAAVTSIRLTYRGFAWDYVTRFFDAIYRILIDPQAPASPSQPNLLSKMVPILVENIILHISLLSILLMSHDGRSHFWVVGGHEQNRESLGKPEVGWLSVEVITKPN